MTIGFILLAILAVMMFFSFTRNVFSNVGPSWLVFSAIAVMAICAAIPSPVIGNVRFNIGAFIVPIVVSVALMVQIGFNKRLLRTFIAFLAVGAVMLATRLLISPFSLGSRIASSVIAGVISAIVAYLISGTINGTISATLGGTVLGDVAWALVSHFVSGELDVISFGLYGAFDAIVISAVLGIIICALAKGFFRLPRAQVNNAEAGEDNKIDANDVDGYDDYFKS